MTKDDPFTRRVVAIVLGVIGLMVLLDVLIIAIIKDHPDLSGARTILIIIIGGLLIIGGVLTVAWPAKVVASPTDMYRPENVVRPITEDPPAP